MPRTTAVESPGCPPFRALTTDVLGLVKVVEARAKPAGVAKVVETWGTPDASRAVLAASLADRAVDPVLAVARKNGVVELLNPLNGDALAAVKAAGPEPTDGAAEEDPIVALHMFRKQAPDSSMLGTFLACTKKGKAWVKSVAKENTASDLDVSPASTWDVCNGGKMQFSSVDAGESYVMFGGPGLTALVRLYDTASQRRPVISVDFRESPIKAVAEDPNGHTVYIGTGTGDLASFDMRTGCLGIRLWKREHLGLQMQKIEHLPVVLHAEPLVL